MLHVVQLRGNKRSEASSTYSWSLIQRHEVWALCSVGVQNQAKAYWRREKKRQEEGAWGNSCRGRCRSFGATHAADKDGRAACVKPCDWKVSRLSLTQRTSCRSPITHRLRRMNLHDQGKNMQHIRTRIRWIKREEISGTSFFARTVFASLDQWFSNKWGGRVSLIVQSEVQNFSSNCSHNHHFGQS